MWQNLRDDIVTAFGALEGCLQPKAYDQPDWEFGPHYKVLLDPHREADQWIAASAHEREHLRAAAEEKHARVVAFLGKEERAQIVARRNTEGRWRRRNMERHRANCRRWDAANRPHRAEYHRARRARLRALGIAEPRYQKTEAQRAHKREYDRAYRKRRG